MCSWKGFVLLWKYHSLVSTSNLVFMWIGVSNRREVAWIPQWIWYSRFKLHNVDGPRCFWAIKWQLAHQQCCLYTVYLHGKMVCTTLCMLYKHICFNMCIIVVFDCPATMFRFIRNRLELIKILPFTLHSNISKYEKKSNGYWLCAWFCFYCSLLGSDDV